jgi:D-3-phosphoglycerate dehydrogenase
MLCLARRICEGYTIAKSGGWAKLPGTDVWQKTLGIIGTGRIGQAVIKRSKGFDMKILAYDVFQEHKVARDLGFEYTSLERVLTDSDFVSLHCSLNPTTRGLLSKNRIALMKPTAYFINTARAEIVDEEALYDALRNRRIAGAAISVYSKVPPPKDFPLSQLGNVVVTPWIAAQSKESWESTAFTTVQNILRVFKGEKPLYAVNTAGQNNVEDS